MHRPTMEALALKFSHMHSGVLGPLQAVSDIRPIPTHDAGLAFQPWASHIIPSRPIVRLRALNRLRGAYEWYRATVEV